LWSDFTFFLLSSISAGADCSRFLCCSSFITSTKAEPSPNHQKQQQQHRSTNDMTPSITSPPKQSPSNLSFDFLQGERKAEPRNEERKEKLERQSPCEQPETIQLSPSPMPMSHDSNSCSNDGNNTERDQG